MCHRRGLASGDAPSGDLNTEARGLTSEMKFIIALSGSLIEVFSLSCFEGVSLGSFDVSARRTRFKARVLGRPPPAAQRAASAGETEGERAAAESDIVYLFVSCIKQMKVVGFFCSSCARVSFCEKRDAHRKAIKNHVDELPVPANARGVFLTSCFAPAFWRLLLHTLDSNFRDRIATKIRSRFSSHKPRRAREISCIRFRDEASRGRFLTGRVVGENDKKGTRALKGKRLRRV